MKSKKSKFVLGFGIWILGVSTSPVIETERTEQLWQSVLVTVGVKPEEVQMPKVIMAKLSQELARQGGEVRGTYNPITHTATAVDEEALRHELCHAVLFKTEGFAAMRDELRVRACSMGAALYLAVKEERDASQVLR